MILYLKFHTLINKKLINVQYYVASNASAWSKMLCT